MPEYDYKTIALPRLISGQRRRRQSAAEFVAGFVEDALNQQAESGWEYVETQEFSTLDRSGILGRVEPVAFAVLVFRRPRRGALAEAAPGFSPAPSLTRPRLPAPPAAPPRLTDEFGKP